MENLDDEIIKCKEVEDRKWGNFDHVMTDLVHLESLILSASVQYIKTKKEV